MTLDALQVLCDYAEKMMRKKVALKTGTRHDTKFGDSFVIQITIDEQVIVNVDWLMGLQEDKSSDIAQAIDHVVKEMFTAGLVHSKNNIDKFKYREG